VVKLVYSGSVVVGKNSINVSFDPSNTAPSNYKLSGFINDGDTIINNSVGNLSISGLQPGLNQICVRAVHKDNTDIYTDWLTLDIIYAAEEYKQTSVAVNGVSSYITNNGIATLYELTIHSPNSEEIEIVTYLEDEEPTEFSTPQNPELKREIINPSVYDINTHIAKSDYKKYIEVISDNSKKYLQIKIDGVFYNFLTPYVYDGANYLD
jgi:hypothetical protein